MLRLRHPTVRPPQTSEVWRTSEVFPTMDEIGTYQEREFPALRNPTVDTLELRRRKHHIPVLFDHDVTDGAPVARFIRRLKELLEAGHGLGELAEGANDAATHSSR